MRMQVPAAAPEKPMASVPMAVHARPADLVHSEVIRPQSQSGTTSAAAAARPDSSCVVCATCRSHG
jgi:hypothetical protein